MASRAGLTEMTTIWSRIKLNEFSGLISVLNYELQMEESVLVVADDEQQRMNVVLDSDQIFT